MIEYCLSVVSIVSTILLVAITPSLLRRYGLNFDRIAKDLESLNHIWGFLGNFKRWSDFYDNLNANDQTLRQKLEQLNCKREDLRNRANNEERRTGRNRNNEVEHWSRSAERKVMETQELLKKTERVTNHFLKFVYQAWLGNLVEIKIREVDYLNSRTFEEVLSYSRVPLQMVLPSLVGDALIKNRDTIITWLVGGYTRIGVHGIEGIGKTTLISSVYNKLLTYDSDDNITITIISVEDGDDEYKLQEKIAKELEIILAETDVIQKRASKLKHALNMKFLLILDGLTRPISEPETIGIPLGQNGRMIITSRDPNVCRRTGCKDKTIEVNQLTLDDALNLFYRKVDVDFVSNPLLKDVAIELVKRCGFVPRKIVDIAAELRGETDINIWREHLNSTTGSNASTSSIED